jgi:hypothetical protein
MVPAEFIESLHRELKNFCPFPNINPFVDHLIGKPVYIGTNYDFIRL